MSESSPLVSLDQQRWSSYQFEAVPPLEQTFEVADSLKYRGVTQSDLCDPFLVASSIGIEIRRVKDMNTAARLMPVRGGFTILMDYAENRADVRQAVHDLGGGNELTSAFEYFWVGHELAHTMFYEWDPGKREHPRRKLEASTAEEIWCDTFSYALLRNSLSDSQLLAIARDISYNRSKRKTSNS